MYIQHQIPIISSARACFKAVQEILQFPIIALDCEGVNLSKDGKLCLIQIATPKRVYLFDVLKGGDRLFFEKGLRFLLENKKVLKIVHDCRRDSEALYYQYGIYLRGVWDSQVAFAILSQLKGSKTPYPVGLNTLFRVCGVEENQFKDSVKNAMSAMRNFWEVRPLSRMMVDYAAGDVKSLLNVYSMINAELTLHANGYEFKRMIEEYSKRYTLMHINVAEGEGAGGGAEAGDDGAIQKGSYNLYGIKLWDDDIGLGSKDVFEDYRIYEKNADNTVSQRVTNMPQEYSPVDRRRMEYDSSSGSEHELEKSEIGWSKTEYYVRGERSNGYTARIVYADGHQYQKPRYYERGRYY